MLIYIDSSIFTGPTSDENTERNIINANRNETNSKRIDFWGGTGGDFEKKLATHCGEGYVGLKRYVPLPSD